MKLSITKAEIGINGNLKAQAALGMHAEGKYEKNYVKNIFSYPVPDAGVKVGRELFTAYFSPTLDTDSLSQIGNLLIVGVIVSLDATADISISAEADVLAGVSLTIANFNANLDMVDSSKSGVSGFQVSVVRWYEDWCRSLIYLRLIAYFRQAIHRYRLRDRIYRTGITCRSRRWS